MATINITVTAKRNNSQAAGPNRRERKSATRELRLRIMFADFLSSTRRAFDFSSRTIAKPIEAVQ
jgi:hypothetical protein